VRVTVGSPVGLLAGGAADVPATVVEVATGPPVGGAACVPAEPVAPLTVEVVGADDTISAVLNVTAIDGLLSLLLQLLPMTTSAATKAQTLRDDSISALLPTTDPG
jgi:hypothetical protein